MSNIERKYAYYDGGVLPEEGAYGTTYLTLYNSDAGNVYDGWLWDPDGHIPNPGSGDEHKRTFGYRNPNYPNYAWDDEVIVDLSNPQNREDIEDVERGRITAFNTSVSDQPIVLEDVDITALTESEREAKATTVLFTAIPLVKDSYIQAAVEVQMKVNISPTNTTGMVRVEAFYILNDESDRTMRPNPVHTFAVATENERHTLPWLYFNPALNHEESNYIGVKLLVTGGTAEIGISDNPDYGDAMITLVSAGLVGDHIFNAEPVAITLSGKELVPYGYSLDLEDYNVDCEYDDGSHFDVTKLCTYTPAVGTVINDSFTLIAEYQGLTDSMEVEMSELIRIEIVGPNTFHGSLELSTDDYRVLGVYAPSEPGEEPSIMDITDDCTFSPIMGTVITSDTTLLATYILPTSEEVYTDSLLITGVGVSRTYGDDILYTYYDDGYLVISGDISDNYTITDEIHRYSTTAGQIPPSTKTTTHEVSIRGTSYHGVSKTFNNVRFDYKNSARNNAANYILICPPVNPTNIVEYKVHGKPFALIDLGSATGYKGFENLDTSRIMSLADAFKNSTANLSFLNDLEFPALKDMIRTFDGSSLTGLTSLDTSHVVDMTNTFAHLNTEDIPAVIAGLDVSNVALFNQTFAYSECETITRLSGWNTSSAVSMAGMFREMHNLVSMNGISGFDVSHVDEMDAMFYYCENLESALYILNWDPYSIGTGNAYNSGGGDTYYMFENCTAIQPPLPSWYTPINS